MLSHRMAMRVLVLDNYDSFTWNLVQALEGLGARCAVHRSDAIGLDQIADLAPDRIVLSPGPLGPEETGVCRAVVRNRPGGAPILGVCLGMQVMADVAGAGVARAAAPVHGKTSRVTHDGRGVFAGLPSPLTVARYHSLAVDPASLPADWEPTAWIEGRLDATLMGCRHRTLALEGVQFHPESFLTEHGKEMLANFLRVLPPKGA
jgi:anthranilate synthase/aminodeoxychorismate synthase-like glutamine amidotransferase